MPPRIDPEAMYEITLKTQTHFFRARSFTVEVCMRTSVTKLKEMCSEIEEWPTEKIRLMTFSGREMYEGDGKTMSYYDVQKNGRVHLMLVDHPIDYSPDGDGSKQTKGLAAKDVILDPPMPVAKPEAEAQKA